MTPEEIAIVDRVIKSQAAPIQINTGRPADNQQNSQQSGQQPDDNNESNQPNNQPK